MRSLPLTWRGPLLLTLRLLVLGIGLGVITGTGLKLLAPQWARPAAGGSTPVDGSQGPQGLTAPGGSVSLPRGRPMGHFEMRRELPELSKRWAELAAAQKDLQASAFLLVLDDGRFAQLQPDRPLPAASSIKSPILLAAMEEFDAGRLAWNVPLPLTQEVIGGGAGWMGGQAKGTRFPLYLAATEMIRVSDNTATNLLIKRLGGKTAVNGRFAQLGLTATVVRNWLPDLDGTNTTSSRDLAHTIALVDTGEKLSPRARDLFRETLSHSHTNTLIPLGLLHALGKDAADPDSELLAEGITVLNKTGDIGISYADGALIELPDGRRAVAAFMVKGPFNDPRSTNLIRAMAGAMVKVLVPAAYRPIGSR
ncbi:MAG: serine hydrolase [Cyanobacteriota bacterium]